MSCCHCLHPISVALRLAVEDDGQPHKRGKTQICRDMNQTWIERRAAPLGNSGNRRALITCLLAGMGRRLQFALATRTSADRMGRPNRLPAADPSPFATL